MSSQCLYSLTGERYDISNKNIRCRAEMDGATVFEVNGRIGRLRVLDFSEMEAELTYRNEVNERHPLCHECGREESMCVCCPNCGNNICDCDDDD